VAAAVDLKSGSIQETFELLKRWCLRPGWGLARVGWDSAISRERVTDLLRAALAEAGVSFQQMELPAGASSDCVARDLLARLATLPPGVVSITGLEWAYPEGGSLHETLGALNFVRETIASFPLRQIWWMPQHIAEQFVLAIPDLESWFSLRLHLEEELLADRRIERPVADIAAISTAEASHLADQLVERMQNAGRAGIAGERIWSELGRPLLNLLKEGGLDDEREYWLARLASFRGRLEEQVRTVQAEKGEGDSETLKAKADLAALMREQGDLAAAAQLWSSILEAAPNSIPAMSNLAAVQSEQGRLAEARELEERVVHMLEEKSGPEDSDLLMPLNDLSITMHDMGDNAGARRLQERAVRIARRTLGDEHPQTLFLTMSLANTLQDQGDATASKRLLEQVVAAQSNSLGPEHKHTMVSRLNLALALKRLGDWQAARTLEEEVLESSRRLMGERHLLTTQAAANLLWTLLRQGELAEANPLFHRSLEWLLSAAPSSLSAPLLRIQSDLREIGSRLPHA
jgi:tetratricopeptide (TPR) repeat protein